MVLLCIYILFVNLLYITHKYKQQVSIYFTLNYINCLKIYLEQHILFFHCVTWCLQQKNNNNNIKNKQDIYFSFPLGNRGEQPLVVIFSICIDSFLSNSEIVIALFVCWRKLLRTVWLWQVEIQMDSFVIIMIITHYWKTPIT